MTFDFLKLKKKICGILYMATLCWILCDLNTGGFWESECSSLMDANRGRVSFQHRGSMHSLTFSMGFGIYKWGHWLCCCQAQSEGAVNSAVSQLLMDSVSFQVSIPSDSTVFSMLSFSLYHHTHTPTQQEIQQAHNIMEVETASLWLL